MRRLYSRTPARIHYTRFRRSPSRRWWLSVLHWEASTRRQSCWTTREVHGHVLCLLEPSCAHLLYLYFIYINIIFILYIFYYSIRAKPPPKSRPKVICDPNADFRIRPNPNNPNPDSDNCRLISPSSIEIGLWVCEKMLINLLNKQLYRRRYENVSAQSPKPKLHQENEQEVKVISQKAPRGGPFPG